jgi:hypothetical protein
MLICPVLMSELVVILAASLLPTTFVMGTVSSPHPSHLSSHSCVVPSFLLPLGRAATATISKLGPLKLC